LNIVRAYIGLGSNLGEREPTLRAALADLDAADGVEVVAASTFRETDPVGPVLDQPRFLNGAAALDTSLGAAELLGLLLAVERRHGRSREGLAGGPRTLDLDLLLYGDAELEEPGLTVPHPRLAERRFALEPLAELRPGLEVPGKATVEALLARLD
jgi:2-amino-4-hydroxy-6-hydroxymethyldihydropteridine diphosphokinase